MSIEVSESQLVGILRFSNHADPMFCICGHTWGHHGRKNWVSPLQTWPTDCGGLDVKDEICPCMGFKYDFSHPANMYVKLLHDEFV